VRGGGGGAAVAHRQRGGPAVNARHAESSRGQQRSGARKAQRAAQRGRAGARRPGAPRERRDEPGAGDCLRGAERRRRTSNAPLELKNEERLQDKVDSLTRERG
jgi:hypothetical protein